MPFGSGAGAISSSSRRMKRLVVVQSCPPHSTGQCGTAQPLAFSFRCQPTMSSLFGTTPSISFCFSSAGRFALIHARTSSRNASSSAVKLMSIGVSPVSPETRQRAALRILERSGRPSLLCIARARVPLRLGRLYTARASATTAGQIRSHSIFARPQGKYRSRRPARAHDKCRQGRTPLTKGSRTRGQPRDGCGDLRAALAP